MKIINVDKSEVECLKKIVRTLASINGLRAMLDNDIH